jgi:uncharacterized membrane protein
MIQGEVLTLVLSAHVVSLPIVIPIARTYFDRSEWLHKSLGGLDDLLLRLRQNLGEALRRQLAAVPLPPARPLLLDERGEQRPLPDLPAAEGEAFRNAVHDFVLENLVMLRSYSIAYSARNSWARWAKRTTWAGLLLGVWQLVATLLVFLSKVLDWGWTTRTLVGTLAPTVVLVASFVLCLVGTAINHDRIMDVRRAHDPL